MSTSLDEIMDSVAELGAAVRSMPGASRASLERMVREILAEERHVRSGYRPPDTLDVGDNEQLRLPAGEGRLEAILSHPPGQVARALGCDETTVRRAHAAWDRAMLASVMLGVDPRETEAWKAGFRPLRAALDTGTAGEGSEFVPTMLSASLIERVNVQLQVASLFPAVDMRSNPYELPGFATSRTRTGRHPEQTADSGQTKIKKITPGTRKISLSAQKFAVECLLSREEEEDALVDVLPWVQSEITDYLSFDIEDAIVNGDTAGTHRDADVTASDDPRKAFEGLRKRVLVTSRASAGGAALTPAMLRTCRGLMGVYGTQASDLAVIVGVAGYLDLLADDDVQTLDKYGPNATILTGELGKVDGVPVIVSEAIREDLNASGVYDGSVTNRTVALLVSRRGFVIGNRRALTLEVLRELYAESDQVAVKATVRKAFTGRFDTASEPTVSEVYNIAV
jgi:hypothetical protein